MPLINGEINFNLNWSEKCIIFERNRVTTLAITDTKLHVAVVALLTQDNTKILQQLKSRFKFVITGMNISGN